MRAEFRIENNNEAFTILFFSSLRRQRPNVVSFRGVSELCIDNSVNEKTWGDNILDR